MWHARLAYVGVDTIKSSAKHEVAAGLDTKKSTADDLPCASCVGRKIARHTFPDQGSDAENALDVVHIDLCGLFHVAANDGSLYFLLLKDRKARFTVKMLRSDRGGEFLGRAFTDLVEDKGILHNLTCPYTLQQNGMAEREMRTVVEAVRMMLLHMGVKHQWWHLALRQAFWQRRGGKLAPKAHWGLHLGVSAESKGWEVLDLTDNKVVTTVEAIFYETLSMEIWKVEYGSASTRTPSTPPTNSSSVHPPLLVADDELDEDDTDDVTPSPPPLFQGSSSAAGDEGRLGASPAAPTSCIASGQRDA
ncbi:unnamed protein product [Closterium sp. NIES-53]